MYFLINTVYLSICLSIISCTLIALYLPNQIVFLLSFTGKTELGQPLHKFTSFMAFLTTCVNPFIYGLSNKNYQQRYWRILSALCLCLSKDLLCSSIFFLFIMQGKLIIIIIITLFTLGFQSI